MKTGGVVKKREKTEDEEKTKVPSVCVEVLSVVVQFVEVDKSFVDWLVLSKDSFKLINSGFSWKLRCMNEIPKCEWVSKEAILYFHPDSYFKKEKSNVLSSDKKKEFLKKVSVDYRKMFINFRKSILGDYFNVGVDLKKVTRAVTRKSPIGTKKHKLLEMISFESKKKMKLNEKTLEESSNDSLYYDYNVIFSRIEKVQMSSFRTKILHKVFSKYGITLYQGTGLTYSVKGNMMSTSDMNAVQIAKSCDFRFLQIGSVVFLVQTWELNERAATTCSGTVFVLNHEKYIKGNWNDNYGNYGLFCMKRNQQSTKNKEDSRKKEEFKSRLLLQEEFQKYETHDFQNTNASSFWEWQQAKVGEMVVFITPFQIKLEFLDFDGGKSREVDMIEGKLVLFPLNGLNFFVGYLDGSFFRKVAKKKATKDLGRFSKIVFGNVVNSNYLFVRLPETKAKRKCEGHSAFVFETIRSCQLIIPLECQLRSWNGVVFSEDGKLIGRVEMKKTKILDLGDLGITEELIKRINY